MCIKRIPRGDVNGATEASAIEKKNQTFKTGWWHKPVIPATQKTEKEGLILWPA